ncbi:MAG: alpha/beta hydrolase [Gammaproteobacteria bacterium]|nr:alpha/beta hydrolase [Gammaproteobacteria bacterium]
MVKASKSRSMFIAGPAGQLQCLFEVPASGKPTGKVVVCHPHPQHGGTMRNKVAHTLARAFVRVGYAALRFNFRGTEASEGRFDDGVGELDDALTAIEWMREQELPGELWLAGFSFGAAIAVRAAIETDVDGLISVAPAISRFASQLKCQPTCPWLVLQGDEDELVNIDETIDWFNGLDPGPELQIVEGAEHFFHGRLTDLREAVTAFVAGAERAPGQA